MKIFNSKAKKNTRQNLRNKMPLAEIVLWSKIKGRQLFGFKFRRQQSIGNYIVDFYCSQVKLVLEIDGDSHYFTRSSRIYDKKRDEYLRLIGIKTIHFKNDDIYHNLDSVLEKVANVVQNHPAPLLRKEGIVVAEFSPFQWEIKRGSDLEV